MGKVFEKNQQDVQAYLFDRGDQTVCLAIWATEQNSSSLNLSLSSEQILQWRDFLGREHIFNSTEFVKVDVTTKVQYLTLPIQVAKKLLALPAKKVLSKKEHINPQTCFRIVSRLVFPQQQVNRGNWSYALDSTGDNTASLEIYNLNPQTFSGVVTFDVPEHWQVQPRELKIQIPGMSRIKHQVTLQSLMPDAIVRSLYLKVHDEKGAIVDTVKLRISNGADQ